MLYDPKWEQETKADPFSLASLIAWLEKQPAETEYSYIDPRFCVIGQWRKAMGAVDVVVSLWNAPMNKFWAIAISQPRTFGAALTRARMVAATGDNNAL
jgi:hypothetical protein